MLGIQQKSGTYETPDSSSVMNFLANVNEVDATDDATYETPDKEVVDGFTNALKKNESGGNLFVFLLLLLLCYYLNIHSFKIHEYS